MKYLVRIYEEEFERINKRDRAYKYNMEFDTPIYRLFDTREEAIKYADEPKCCRFYESHTLEVPVAVVYELNDKEYAKIKTDGNELDFTELNADAEIYVTYTDAKSIEEIEKKDGITIEY